MRLVLRSVFMALGLAGSMMSTAASASVLDTVKLHGDIRCGVFPDDPGRSALNVEGNWEGFYVDFCRATAAALFGDPDRVQYLEVDATTRFTSLQKAEADVVMYSTTRTLGRELNYGVRFPAIYLFDGQGFLVRTSSGIDSVHDMSGKSICVTENTSTHQNLVDLLKARGVDAQIHFSNGDSFFRGNCDAYTADRMNLAVNRAHRAENPDEYRVLPLAFTREPIGPMVAEGDEAWARAISAVVNGLILADEKGITRDNVRAMAESNPNGEVQKLLGVSGDLAERLGLPQDWAINMIRSVGNYSEIYQRHFGPDTAVGIEQGLNKPWSRGGILYAPLFQ